MHVDLKAVIVTAGAFLSAASTIASADEATKLFSVSVDVTSTDLALSSQVESYLLEELDTIEDIGEGRLLAYSIEAIVQPVRSREGNLGWTMAVEISRPLDVPGAFRLAIAVLGNELPKRSRLRRTPWNEIEISEEAKHFATAYSERILFALHQGAGDELLRDSVAKLVAEFDADELQPRRDYWQSNREADEQH